METFIAGIGERYLQGKANNIPQQLENLAKKQFSSGTDSKKQAEQAPTLPSEEKDQEIAKLRKQLAKTKLDKGKASGEAKAANSRKGKAIAEEKSVESEKSKLSKRSASETKQSGSSAKGKARLNKGLIPLSIDADAGSEAAKGTKGSEARRGRRSSVSTATAATEHKASSGQGGGHASKPGNDKGGILGLETLGATEALPHKAKGTRCHKAASAAQASEHGGTAKSTSSTLRASSCRRRSTSRASEVGSEARSTRAMVAPRPPPPPPMHHALLKQEAIYAEEVRHYEVEELGIYVVEVEEEPLRRRKGMRGRSGGGDPGVIEVQSSKGRTVYRVT